MSCTNNILAKSVERGGTPLTKHLQSTAYYAQIAAHYAKMDEYLAKMGALLHDIGKASPIFQKRLQQATRNPLAKPFRHEIASLFFLPLVDKKWWPALIDMIVAHHKSIVADAGETGIIDLENLEGDEAFDHHASEFEIWKNDALAILKEIEFLNKEDNRTVSIQDAFDTYLFAVDYCRKKKKNWSIWKGLLMGADHFASAVDELEGEIPTLFTIPNVSFYTRTSPLYPLSLIASDTTKRHTFVKAPTGAGKTDLLMKRCKGRIFYVLPFQASINAMYERIKKDLKGVTDDVRLLHASSQLILKGDQVIEERAIQDKFGAAVKVLTPQQLAAITLGTKGYESILFDIQGCDVILDEIHTYSEIMQSIVLKMIEILDAIGCRIHIGTATMPTSLEHSILSLLQSDNIQFIELDNKTLQSFNRHTIHKIQTFDSAWPILQESIPNKKKILIVCNRVTQSQDIYRTISDKYPNVKKLLIHSRFKRGDRIKLEKVLKDEYNTSEEACIVVATQVVEVSLDISFDVMITETAPIDSMIQRFGRINRKRTPNTIGHYKPIYVIAPPEGKKNCMPYNEDILQKSFNVLPDNALLKETSIQALIDQVYPEIKPINIDLDAVYRNGKWALKELQHLPKSALIERLDIDSVSCIVQKDKEEYKSASNNDRILLEIPVRQSMMRWSKLDSLKVGSHPFIIPDCAYTSEEGLISSKLSSEYYNTEYQFL